MLSVGAGARTELAAVACAAEAAAATWELDERLRAASRQARADDAAREEKALVNEARECEARVRTAKTSGVEALREAEACLSAEIMAACEAARGEAAAEAAAVAAALAARLDDAASALRAAAASAAAATAASPREAAAALDAEVVERVTRAKEAHREAVEAQLRAAQALLDARILARWARRYEAARAAAALSVDREAAERAAACSDSGPRPAAEQHVRDAVAATVAAMVDRVADDADVRAAIEPLAAGASEAHAAGERDQTERGLSRFTGVSMRHHFCGSARGFAAVEAHINGINGPGTLLSRRAAPAAKRRSRLKRQPAKQQSQHPPLMEPLSSPGEPAVATNPPQRAPRVASYAEVTARPGVVSTHTAVGEASTALHAIDEHCADATDNSKAAGSPLGEARECGVAAAEAIGAVASARAAKAELAELAAVASAIHESEEREAATARTVADAAVAHFLAEEAMRVRDVAAKTDAATLRTRPRAAAVVAGEHAAAAALSHNDEKAERYDLASHVCVPRRLCTPVPFCIRGIARARQHTDTPAHRHRWRCPPSLRYRARRRADRYALRRARRRDRARRRARYRKEKFRREARRKARLCRQQDRQLRSRYTTRRACERIIERVPCDGVLTKARSQRRGT